MALAPDIESKTMHPTEGLSSFPPPATANPLADQQMTADRSERKYLVSALEATQLGREFNHRLERHYPPGFVTLPGTRQYSTTIYFDTVDRQLFRAAERGSTSVKLRAREYYNFDPSLAQLARRTRDLVRFDPVIWFELKSKQGDHVTKQRFALAKDEVPQFLSQGEFSAASVEIQQARFGPQAEQLMQDVTDLYRRFNQPFQVDCIVNYRRIAWQDEAGSLRLTLDRQVSFFEPLSGLWTRQEPLTRESLGPVRASAPGAVLEVKLRGEPPPWLSECLAQLAGLPCGFSKFLAASRAVHG